MIKSIISIPVEAEDIEDVLMLAETIGNTRPPGFLNEIWVTKPEHFELVKSFLDEPEEEGDAVQERSTT